MQQVNLKFKNWKLISYNNLENEFKKQNNKWYILKYKNQIILKEKYTQKDKIRINNFENYKMIKFGKRMIQQIELIFYRWDGVNEPQTPEIDTDTGSVFLDWY